MATRTAFGTPLTLRQQANADRQLAAATEVVGMLVDEAIALRADGLVGERLRVIIAYATAIHVAELVQEDDTDKLLGVALGIIAAAVDRLSQPEATP